MRRKQVSTAWVGVDSAHRMRPETGRDRRCMSGEVPTGVWVFTLAVVHWLIQHTFMGTSCVSGFEAGTGGYGLSPQIPLLSLVTLTKLYRLMRHVPVTSAPRGDRAYEVPGTQWIDSEWQQFDCELPPMHPGAQSRHTWAQTMQGDLRLLGNCSRWW